MILTKQHHGFFYAILATFFSVIMSLFVKLAAPHVPISAVIFFRFFIGLIGLSPWLLRARLDFSWEHLPKHLIRDLGGLAAIACFFLNINQLPLVNAQTLSNTAPLFIPIVAFFALNAIVPKRRIIALLIGFLGVFVILRPQVHHFTDSANIIGVIGGLLTAVSLVYVRKLSRVETTRTILLTYFIVASVVSLLPTIYFWKPIHEPILWAYLIAIGIAGTIYQYLLTLAYTHAPASKISIISYLSVVFGGFFGWLFWKEEPDIWVWIGMILIIAGGVFALLDQTPSRKRGDKQK